MPSVRIPHSKVKIFYVGGKPPAGSLPVIFVHGAGGTHRHWVQQEKSFRQPFTFISLDLPGHGNSSGNAANRTAIYRDYIRALSRELKLPPFVLAGHSMGGAIALDYALAYPEDLRGIILLGTGARLRVLPKIIETYRKGEHYEPFFELFYGPEAPPNLKEETLTQLKSVDPSVYYADLTACDNFDVMDSLGKINLPVLIIVGEEDKLTPVKYGDFLKKNLPRAKMTVISRAGHMAMQEKPEEVSRAIFNFLTAITSG